MNQVLVVTLTEEIKVIHQFESELLSKVKECYTLGGGLYHKLTNVELTSVLDICEVSKLYLILRMYFIYNTMPKIDIQITNLNDRKKVLKKHVFKFLYNIDNNITMDKTTEIINFILFDVFFDQKEQN